MALLVGLDVGSTTTKVYAMHEDMTEAWWGYRRHGACQTASVRAMLGELAERFPHESLRVAVTGSGARDIATALGASYVQEVVANALAISRFYPQTRCAIELGGQDAKMIFFRTNDKGDIEVADMRMNGSCAGGTGAFIDEMAKLMGVGTESGEFEQLASRGTTVHEVSGRCGVYAKTDIQPLLNEGIPTTDLALSALHAVARQTIGGLAQGIDIEPPVIFEGGTLAYNPTLVRVFREQLNLSDDQVIVPRDPQIMVARGAALSLTDMFASSQPIDLPDALSGWISSRRSRPQAGRDVLPSPFLPHLPSRRILRHAMAKRRRQRVRMRMRPERRCVWRSVSIRGARRPSSPWSMRRVSLSIRSTRLITADRSTSPNRVLSA